jgi:RNA polymerase subunit RPABC4/transcription elongation factor Spt4
MNDQIVCQYCGSSNVTAYKPEIVQNSFARKKLVQYRECASCETFWQVDDLHQFCPCCEQALK